MMVEWLLKHKILDLIFNQKTYHVQIIQRSDLLIKFLIEQNAFYASDLDKVWEA
jgi:hypothetical protein